MTKMLDYIRLFGSALNFFGGPGESHHKYFVKAPGANTQQRVAEFAKQISNRIYEGMILEVAKEALNKIDNEFELVGTTYINPIASGGTERYLFILQDTTVVDNDTTFTISYRPRINKNFKGMEGTMYINTNGYAIEKVIASPFSRDTVSSFTAKIVQEYQFIDGKKWFPTNLSTHVELKGLSLNSSGGYVAGTGHTYIKDIVINPEDLKKRGFGNISIATDEDAGIVNDKVWDEYRIDPLTDKEKRTYNDRKNGHQKVRPRCAQARRV